jgi:hypothetical protein
MLGGGDWVGTAMRDAAGNAAGGAYGVGDRAGVGLGVGEAHAAAKTAINARAATCRTKRSMGP